MSTLPQPLFESMNDPTEPEESLGESVGVASTEEIDLDPYYDIPCTD